MKIKKYKPVYIFSVTKDDHGTLSEYIKSNKVFVTLTKLDIDFKFLNGHYKGSDEVSILVAANDTTKELVTEICKDYKQDCFLFLDEDRNSFYIEPDSQKSVYIGKFKSINKMALKGLDYWTFDPEGNTYWAVV